MIKNSQSYRGEEKWTASCDTCSTETPQKDFPTAGEAADHARLAGFVTREGQQLVDPMTWHCTACVGKQQTRK